jgi:hypothetical protein
MRRIKESLGLSGTICFSNYTIYRKIVQELLVTCFGTMGLLVIQHTSPPAACPLELATAAAQWGRSVELPFDAIRAGYGWASVFVLVVVLVTAGLQVSLDFHRYRSFID